MSGGLSYEDAVSRLGRASRFGIHPSLDTITTLTDALGRPQDAFACIQVAGTNGKTSTARMTAALLAAEGARTGLYTSPYLTSRTDQYEIDGTPIGEDAFGAAADEVFRAARSLQAEPTEFELTTALALVAFRDAGVEWAVLEVGMGGRWDATSVVSPRVAVITGVALDHTEHLGSTREAIAREKACIIGPGSTAVLGPGVGGVLEVFLRRAGDVGSRALCVRRETDACEITYDVSRPAQEPGGTTVVAVETERAEYTEIAVAGPGYQAANVACALAAAEAALGRSLDARKARAALLGLRYPGRFDPLSTRPAIVADGAHNPDAARALAGAAAEIFGDERPVIVLGVLDDKDLDGIVTELAEVAAGFIATASGVDRARPALEVAAAVERATGGRPPVTATVGEAVALARETGSPVLVTGSITVAAEARRALGG